MSTTTQKQINYRDLAQVARNEVSLNETPEQTTNRLLDQMTLTDLRDIVYDVYIVRIRDEFRQLQMSQKNNGARSKIVQIKPRDTSTTRPITKAKESHVSKGLDKAQTLAQRTAAFYGLASETYRIPGNGLKHARDMTRTDWVLYRDAQIKKRAGFDQSIAIANEAIAILDEAKVSTLAEVLYPKKP